MEFFKDQLRSRAPGLFAGLRSGRDTIQRWLASPTRVFHPWWRDSSKRLADYQDRYRGERCFVIGNGPSLSETDLSLLAGEYSFGMNRIYLAFEERDFRSTFLVSVNDLVIEQCRQDFHDLPMPKFFSWRSRELLYPDGVPDRQTHFLNTSYTGRKFSTHVLSRFWEGATVTNICLQLAYCMGFSEVYLIGVDHSFSTTGKANQTIVSNGADPNHFSPDYFGKGFRWQLPDLDTSEIAYQLALEVYQAAGRQVFDATIGGKLEIFPRVDYYDLFKA